MVGYVTAVAAAGMFALAAPAGAAPPAGPCEEIVYVGKCVHVGGQQGPTVQQPYGEFSVTPDTGSGVAITNSIG